MFTKEELETIARALSYYQADHHAPPGGDPATYNALTSLIGKARLAHATQEKRRANALRVASEIDDFQDECAEAEYTDTERAGHLLIEARSALRSCAKTS